MLKIKYDLSSLGKVLEPGVTSLVFDAFREKLERKLENIVEEVYSELEKELPTKISAAVSSALTPDNYDGTVRVDVVIDLRKEKTDE